MKKNSIKYVQCKMTKHVKDRLKYLDTSWIPKKFAQKDRSLKLKIDGEWDDGWIVEEVYSSTELTHDEVTAISNHHKKFREVTDI